MAVHAFVLTGLPELTGPAEPNASVLNAQLVTPEPPKPQVAAATPPTPVARKTALPPAPPPPASPRRVQAPDPAAITVPEPTNAEPVAESTEPSAPELKPEPTSVAQEPQEPAPPESAASTPSAATEPVRDLPQTGSISYVLFIGSNKFSVGRTVQTWEIGAQTYRLSSSSETTGLAGFLRPYQLGYLSEGRVDASGLRPESFSVRRGRDGAQQQYAVRFDWATKELTLGPASAPRKVALLPGTLDLLSFIYQLARAPLAPGRLQINITTGNKLENYTLVVGAEEDIEVPLGTIRAVPVRQVRIPGQESIEIWLAPERQYLPVRIRFLDRNGEMSGEQVAAEITTDER